MISVSHQNSPYRLHIIISKVLPKSSNYSLGRNPFIARGNARTWRKRISQAVALFHPEVPLESVKIQILKHSWRFSDFDGLVSSLKPVIDGLVPTIMKDDTWNITGPWEVDQVKCKRGEEKLEIIVSQRV